MTADGLDAGFGPSNKILLPWIDKDRPPTLRAGDRPWLMSAAGTRKWFVCTGIRRGSVSLSAITNAHATPWSRQVKRVVPQ
ncbi:hypothetical protein ACLQ3C_18580 [Gordonia sp. DT30]|uniref:hypothetical protein n=1 Tax=unclassified Gordonia (in: high G+C Gram-positive bacteria) TaxID=2657482 RepID=UPI003CE8E6A6